MRENSQKNPAPRTMAEIFISYSRKNKDFVRQLADALAGQERQAWVDWKDIPSTAEWQKEIFVNIEAADNFIFVISPESVASASCKNEIAHAAANNKRIVPVLYELVPDGASPRLWTSSREWTFRATIVSIRN